MRRSLVVITLLVIAGGLSWWMPVSRRSSCEWAQDERQWKLAAAFCLVRYQFDHDEQALSLAAKASVRLAEYGDARVLAWKAIRGPYAGDAHNLLGYMALVDGFADTARFHAEAAYAAHMIVDDKSGMSSDAIALSNSSWEDGYYEKALELADQGLRLAREVRDPNKEMNAHIARSAALRLMGNWVGANEASLAAIALEVKPCDKVWAHLKYAMSLLESEQSEGLALHHLATAKKLNEPCSSWTAQKQILTNEASLLKDTDLAGALARVNEVEAREKRITLETQLLRGVLAAHRGAFDESAHYLQVATSLKTPDADWEWELLVAQAELAELRGGLLGDVRAELFYRKAIANVAALRLRSPGHSAYMVSRHRGPYAGLIALLARHRRWRDALAVILQLDASDMLRETASPLHEPEALPAASSTPSDALLSAVLEAWRGRDLVIVIAPERRHIGGVRERAYRLRVLDGAVRGEEVGDSNQARQWAGQLFAAPGDLVAAQALGKMIFPPRPPGTIPASGEAPRLDALAIGALSKAPLNALRDADGALLSEQRPMGRVLALRARTPPVADGGPSVLLMDPLGDLRLAAAEGAVVARALAAESPARQVLPFGSGAKEPATREALWKAAGAGLLHIAGHVASKGRWRALKLADGDVEPAEIVRRVLAPRLAVLAACGSADATDEEGVGSLAAAFLEAGTTAVVATDWSVPDEGAAQLMRSFYAQPDWRADPARALARVQQQLEAAEEPAKKGDKRRRWWMAFSVLVRPPLVLDPPTT